MSLGRAKKNILIETKYKNTILRNACSYTQIGSSDEKHTPTKVYKFSEFDMECNLFRNPANIFTGDIYIGIKYPIRCRIFKEHKIIRGIAHVRYKS